MELTISLPQGDQRLGMLGSAERNLKLIREQLGVNITARNDALRLRGDSGPVGQAAQVVERLSQAARRGRPMDREQVIEAIANVRAGDAAGESVAQRVGRWEADADRQTRADGDAAFDVYLSGRRIKPLTDGQATYVRAMLEHDLTFCVGPAGTGKTYLAVAAAAAMLKQGAVRKLVLARPAVEAGEKLGFLPGDMQQKVNPYLRPLLDALHDMMEFDQIQRFMACDLIEVIPLAFMRGRTLNDAMVILDEAQNTTRSQMLMFLTRLGHHSKMVVTGDTTQIDLEDPRDSGLVDACRRLRRVRGVGFVALEPEDIVRHSLVQRIVDAYGEKPTRQRHEALDAAENHANAEPT